jgi:hypothetical protein
MPQKGNFADDIGYAQTGKRGKLQEGGAWPKHLVDCREPGSDQTAWWPGLYELLFPCTSRLFATDASRERFNRHRKQPPHHDERKQPDRSPEQAVVEENT